MSPTLPARSPRLSAPQALLVTSTPEPVLDTLVAATGVSGTGSGVGKCSTLTAPWSRRLRETLIFQGSAPWSASNWLQNTAFSDTSRPQRPPPPPKRGTRKGWAGRIRQGRGRSSGGHRCS